MRGLCRDKSTNFSARDVLKGPRLDSNAYHAMPCHTISYRAIPYHTVPRYKTKNGASMRSLYQYVMPHLDNDFKDWCVHRWLLTHSRKLVFFLSSDVALY